VPQTAAPHLDPAVAELERRLAGDLAALVDAVTGLDQRQTDWRPGPDRWSIGEVLHHLAVSNAFFAARAGRMVERGHAEGRRAPAGDRRSWPRLRLIADRKASGPVAHPAAATPTHGLPVAELRARLAASHADLVALLPRLAGLDLASITARHPLGFELNLFQWFDAAGAHERRHLVQIEEIKAAAGFPATPEARV